MNCGALLPPAGVSWNLVFNSDEVGNSRCKQRERTGLSPRASSLSGQVNAELELECMLELKRVPDFSDFRNGEKCEFTRGVPEDGVYRVGPIDRAL